MQKAALNWPPKMPSRRDLAEAGVVGGNAAGATALAMAASKANFTHAIPDAMHKGIRIPNTGLNRFMFNIGGRTTLDDRILPHALRSGLVAAPVFLAIRALTKKDNPDRPIVSKSEATLAGSTLGAAATTGAAMRNNYRTFASMLDGSISKGVLGDNLRRMTPGSGIATRLLAGLVLGGLAGRYMYNKFNTKEAAWRPLVGTEEIQRHLEGEAVRESNIKTPKDQIEYQSALARLNRFRTAVDRSDPYRVLDTKRTIAMEAANKKRRKATMAGGITGVAAGSLAGMRGGLRRGLPLTLAGGIGGGLGGWLYGNRYPDETQRVYGELESYLSKNAAWPPRRALFRGDLWHASDPMFRHHVDWMRKLKRKSLDTTPLSPKFRKPEVPPIERLKSIARVLGVGGLGAAAGYGVADLLDGEDTTMQLKEASAESTPKARLHAIAKTASFLMPPVLRSGEELDPFVPASREEWMNSLGDNPDPEDAAMFDREFGLRDRAQAAEASGDIIEEILAENDIHNYNERIGRSRIGARHAALGAILGLIGGGMAGSRFGRAGAAAGALAGLPIGGFAGFGVGSARADRQGIGLVPNPTEKMAEIHKQIDSLVNEKEAAYLKAVIKEAEAYLNARRSGEKTASSRFSVVDEVLDKQAFWGNLGASLSGIGSQIGKVMSHKAALPTMIGLTLLGGPAAAAGRLLYNKAVDPFVEDMRYRNIMDLPGEPLRLSPNTANRYFIDQSLPQEERDAITMRKIFDLMHKYSPELTASPEMARMFMQQSADADPLTLATQVKNWASQDLALDAARANLRTDLSKYLANSTNLLKQWPQDVPEEVLAMAPREIMQNANAYERAKELKTPAARAYAREHGLII